MSTLRTRVSALAACALVASLVLALAPARVEGQVEMPETPVVALDVADGGFFVLASDVPFRVSMAEPEIPWFGVEAVEGPSTEPRIVPLSANPADLAPGTYYSAVRIDLTTLEGSRTLALPVALEVPEPSHGVLPLTALAAGVPAAPPPAARGPSDPRRGTP